MPPLTKDIAAKVAAAKVMAASEGAGEAAAAVEKGGDTELSLFAESVVQILIEMNAQGTQWLDLTETA